MWWAHCHNWAFFSPWPDFAMNLVPFAEKLFQCPIQNLLSLASIYTFKQDFYRKNKQKIAIFNASPLAIIHLLVYLDSMWMRCLTATICKPCSNTTTFRLPLQNSCLIIIANRKRNSSKGKLLHHRLPDWNLKSKNYSVGWSGMHSFAFNYNYIIRPVNQVRENFRFQIFSLT